MTKNITETRQDRKIFYDTNLLLVLRETREYGDVLSMPELLKLRVDNPDDRELWGNWFTALSEENVGIDREGRFGKKDTPVVIAVHGSGILTVERIQKAYDDGLINNAARFSQEDEIQPLLRGELPDKTEIPLFSFKQLRDEVLDLPRRYGVVMDFETLARLESGVQDINSLYDNPLVIVRAGGVEEAREYLDAVKQVYNTSKFGNWHLFRSADPKKAQGRLVFIGSSYDGGLSGGYLDSNARFVGVRAEGAGQKISKPIPNLEQILGF